MEQAYYFSPDVMNELKEKDARYYKAMTLMAWLVLDNGGCYIIKKTNKDGKA
jgi:hypothetical protein